MVNSVTEAVDALLEGLQLNPEGQARAAIARALAGKLDDAALSQSGVVAAAAAGIAKELSATLDALVAGQVDPDDFVSELFGRSQP